MAEIPKITPDELHPNNVSIKVSQKIPDQTAANVFSRSVPVIPNLPVASPIQAVNAASPQLILQTFGLKLLQTEIYKGRIPIAVRDESPILRKSKLGTTIFSDLQFKLVDSIGEHIPVDTVLFSVHQAKNVVRTQIVGRNGRIKEYVGEDDFEINIKGVICGDNGVYPYDHVKNLVNYLRFSQSLGIVSKYLNEIFDIDEVVVYDFKLEQTEGSYSYQKFEMDCWSDKPVEVLIQDGK